MQTRPPGSTIRTQLTKTKDGHDLQFNIKKECTAEKPYFVHRDFFKDDQPRWIVRYATGAEL